MGLARVNEIQQTNEGILGNSQEPETILFFIRCYAALHHGKVIRFN